MAGYDAVTALIVTDVQNDFADPEGSLYVKDGEAIIPFVNVAIERAAAAGALVVRTQDWHPPSTPHFAKDGGVWPVHCVRDTWGADLHPALVGVDGPVIRKGGGGEDGYSAFSTRDPLSGSRAAGTGLEEMLRARGIERVVVVGLATDYCVKETAIDAVAAGFATTLLAEGVRAVDLEPGDGERALDAIRAAGATIEEAGPRPG